MQGIRVLDLTRVLAGPWAAMQMADQGADVIKIEPPGGDETRAFGPVIDGHSTYFVASNRNKRSIMLDLKTDAGREVLYALSADADVLLQNFRPGVAERLGFDFDTLTERFPRLVYVAIHAFGDDPAVPDSRRPGYDLVLQCMGGTVSIGGFPGSAPTRSGVSVADHSAGMIAVQAVLMGLLQRERTGRGQKIVVNMLQVQASTLSYHVTRYTVTGDVEQQRGNAHAGLCPYDIYPCQDGWLAVACGNDAIWQRLRTELELPDRADWSTNLKRVSSRQTVDEAVRTALGQCSVHEADRRLAAAGVPCGAVYDIPRTVAHPATHLVTVPHAHFGSVSAMGPLLQTETTVTEHRAAPMLGEHCSELLAEAGLADEEARLRAAGAFGESSG